MRVVSIPSQAVGKAVCALVVANYLSGDAGLLARWKESRRIPYAKHSRGTAPSSGTVPMPVESTALDAPTPIVPSAPPVPSDVKDDEAA